MNNKECLEIINREPREYRNLLIGIKTHAECYIPTISKEEKQKCKLLMRYLKKQWKEIKKLKEMLKEEENGSNK